MTSELTVDDELNAFFSKHGVGDAPIEPGSEAIAHKIDRTQATINEIKFARGIAAGKNYLEAYCEAFNETAVDAKDKERLRKAGERLAKRPRVAEAIYNIRKRAADLLDVTPAKLIEELQEAQDIARMMAKPEAMISAVKAKAGLLGLDAPKQVNVNHHIQEMDDDKRKILIERAAQRLGRLPKHNDTVSRVDVEDAIEDVEYVRE